MSRNEHCRDVQQNMPTCMWTQLSRIWEKVAILWRQCLFRSFRLQNSWESNGFFCTWATTNLYNPYACKLNPPHPTHDQLACVHTPPPYLYIPVSYLWKTKSTPWTSIVSPVGSTSSTAWCATPNAMKKIRKHWAWRISQVTLSLLTV